MLAIEVEDIHKAFRIPHEIHTTLTERLLSLFRPVSYERFEALRGVNLRIDKGTFTGIIGGNGSGKSTLLKIISGLLQPDRGRVNVHGTMSALLELGLGFSPELTVWENVELYAAVLGYPHREVKRRVEEAIAFAGLERFRDAKLKNLSTGMRARLGFSTALQAESDIMLLDEILAVGDADFQRKCLGVFEDFKRRKCTIILVTHDLSQVQQLCDRAVLLENGLIAASGEPNEVIERYMQTVGFLRPGEAPIGRAERPGDGQARAVEGWVEDARGARVHSLNTGERATVVVRFRAHADLDTPHLGLSISAADGTTVYSITTLWLDKQTEPLSAGQIIEMRVPFLVALTNGNYSVRTAIADQSQRFHDMCSDLVRFTVHGSPNRHGVADLCGEIHYRISDCEDLAAADEVPRQRAKGGLP